MPLRRALLRRLALLGGSLALNACGFRLRGATDLPPGLQSLHLQAPAALSRELATLLAASEIRLTDAPDQADAVLQAGGERYEKRTLSVDPRTGKQRELELAYGVDVTMKAADGTVLLPRQRINLVRDFVFDSDEIIGKSREESVLRDEMRQDAAQQIVWRLAASTLGQ